MKLNELIEQLTALQEQHGGDIDVVKSSVECDWLYDANQPRQTFMNKQHRYEVWREDVNEEDQEVIVL